MKIFNTIKDFYTTEEPDKIKHKNASRLGAGVLFFVFLLPIMWVYQSTFTIILVGLLAWGTMSTFGWLREIWQGKTGSGVKDKRDQYFNMWGAAEITVPFTLFVLFVYWGTG